VLRATKILERVYQRTIDKEKAKADLAIGAPSNSPAPETPEDRGIVALLDEVNRDTRSDFDSAATLLDQDISDRDVYVQVREKLGFKELVVRVHEKAQITRSTLGAYSQLLDGKIPRKSLKPAMIEKIRATIRAIALDVARSDQSFAHGLLQLMRRVDLS
jgi:hypothetical protein